MARRPRIEYEGAIHHVTFRGNERRLIFRDDGDYEALLERMKERVGNYQIRLYLYCLMTNHAHLLVETPKANLSAFMGSLLTSYTNYFNAKYRRSGHLTQGRFRSQLVEGDAYLLRLSRYIHLNPVFVRVWKHEPLGRRRIHLRGYRWSSYPGYADLSVAEEWVDHHPVLAMTEATKSNQKPAYRRYVEAGMARTDDEFAEFVRENTQAIGSEDFIRDVEKRQKHAAERLQSEDVAFRRMARNHEPAAILKTVCAELKTDETTLRRHRKGDWSKAIAATLLVRHAGLTQREVARYLGLTTGAAVCVQIRRLRQSKDASAGKVLMEAERLLTFKG